MPLSPLRPGVLRLQLNRYGMAEASPFASGPASRLRSVGTGSNQIMGGVLLNQVGAEGGGRGRDSIILLLLV